MNGAKLKVGALQGEKDGRGLGRECLGQASRAIYAHCVRGGCLETLPRADPLNPMRPAGPSQQNCYALFLRRKLEYVPSKYTSKCVILVICLFPNGWVCYAAPWYKASMANQYKIKKGREKRELLRTVISLCTHMHSYLHMLDLEGVKWAVSLRLVWSNIYFYCI